MSEKFFAIRESAQSFRGIDIDIVSMSDSYIGLTADFRIGRYFFHSQLIQI